MNAVTDSLEKSITKVCYIWPKHVHFSAILQICKLLCFWYWTFIYVSVCILVIYLTQFLLLNQLMCQFRSRFHGWLSYSIYRLIPDSCHDDNVFNCNKNVCGFPSLKKFCRVTCNACGGKYIIFIKSMKFTIYSLKSFR